MRGNLTNRCKLLEARFGAKPGAQHGREGIGWFLEIDFDLVAVAFVFAAQRADASVRALVREIMPEILARGYRRPTSEQLDWLCGHLRSLWPTFQHDPRVQRWQQRYDEIQEGNHADN